MPPDPPRKDWLRRSVIPVQLLRNFFQLFQNIVSHVVVFPVFKKPYRPCMLIMGNLKIYRGVGVSSTFLAVMRCSYQFFAVLRYSETPNAPLKEPVQVSGRNCSASSFGLVICNFYRYVQSFTTHADAGEQI